MQVVLTPSELLHAAGVGMRRHAANLVAGRHDRHGAPPDWSVHIEGACGELAAAKALGCYWPASVDFRERQAGDLPGGVEVRTTSHAAGCLLLHPEDADDRRFILVTGRAPVFEVRGWCRGWEGKHQQFWKDPAGGRPAFFVDQKYLRPMSEWSAPVDPLRARVESDPAIRRLVAAVDGQVEHVERSRPIVTTADHRD